MKTSARLVALCLVMVLLSACGGGNTDQGGSDDGESVNAAVWGQDQWGNKEWN